MEVAPTVAEFVELGPSPRTVAPRTRLDAVLDQLDGQLIGLAPVKTRIRGIAALLVVDRLRREHGHASERPSLHICSHRQPRQGKDYGGPGDVAEILHRIGYVEQGI